MMNYLIPILISAGTISLWYFARWVLNRVNMKHYNTGFNQAAMHVYNQIKTKGKIDLVLDGQKITIVESRIKESEKKK